MYGYVRDNKLHDLDLCSGYVSPTLPAGFARPAYVVYNPSPALTGVRVGDLLAVTTMFPPQHGDLSLIRYPDGTGEVVVLGESPQGSAVAHKVVATFLK